MSSEFQSDRMIAQQSTYTVSTYVLADHGELLDQVLSEALPGQESYLRITIPGDSKHEFLTRLSHMNVLPSALFPGADGVGRAIRDAYRMIVFAEDKHEKMG